MPESTITQSYVEQYSAYVHMLAEQQMSRLRFTTVVEPGVGEAFSFERMGTAGSGPNNSASVVRERNGETPLTNIEHSRRWAYPVDYAEATLLDKQDTLRILIDPMNKYAMRHASAFGRTWDDRVIEALGGTAMEGKRGTTSVPLPAAQKIGANSSGLTLEKLLQTKEMLDAAETGMEYPRYIICQAKQIRNLLATTEVTNQDYNSVKTLVNGEVNTFLGFTFIRLERLPVDSSSDRLCYAYSMPAVGVKVLMEPSATLSIRGDRLNAMQILTMGSWGAVRVEDELVVEIACEE